MFVFVLCGLWHGAAWTYVITLTLHGFFIVFSNTTESVRKRMVQILRLEKAPILLNAMRMFMTFWFFAFSLIFFRALSVSDAASIISKFFSFEYGFFLGQPSTFIYAVFSILVLMTVDVIQEFFPDRIVRFKSGSVVVRYTAYAAITILIILIGVFDGGQFIYFQF
jgi:D-alanyl-lipoteichoic acid acyltransferase DltB (MBOAT superfamily)